MVSPPADFESAASACSATRAWVVGDVTLRLYGGFLGVARKGPWQGSAMDFFDYGIFVTRG